MHYSITNTKYIVYISQYILCFCVCVILHVFFSHFVFSIHTLVLKLHKIFRLFFCLFLLRFFFQKSYLKISSSFFIVSKEMFILMLLFPHVLCKTHKKRTPQNGVLFEAGISARCYLMTVYVLS